MHLTDITMTVSGLSPMPRTFRLPLSKSEELEALLKKFEDEESIPAQIAFPDIFHPVLGPAKSLRGMRLREELTQKQLAEKLGIRQHHLSEMENGKRPIGKEMAKKLAKALKADYRVFL